MAILTIPSELNQLPFVNKFIKECIPVELMNRLQPIELAVEEILVNIFRYAYCDGTGQAEISCHIITRDDGSFFHITIRDWGHPFDPFQVPHPNLDLGVDERPIGGLGIHIVRTIVDSYTYKRVDNTNIVELFFNILPEAKMII